MSKIKKAVSIILSSILIICTFTGCKVNSADDNAKMQEQFENLCDRLFKEAFEDNILDAHFTFSNPSKYGIEYSEEDYNLGEFSEEYLESIYKQSKEDLKELKKIRRSALTNEQKLTYDTLVEYLDKQDNYCKTAIITNIMGPNSGLISNLSSNFIEFQFYDEEDVRIYLDLLADVENYMNQVFTFLSKQAAAGYFMSDYNADLVIEQCKKYLAAENDPLIVTFEDKIAKLDISESGKDEYIETNREYVEKYFNRAYSDTIDVLNELKGSCTNEQGLCNYGEIGEKYYDAIIKEKTSSDMDGEELADFLDDAMSGLMLELSVILAADYDAYYSALSYQPDFTEPEQVLEYVLDNMGKDFPEPVTLNYNIEYQNKACEVEHSLAYYVTCRIDNVEVNNIKVNGSEVNEDSFQLYNTLAHEGYPGHLYEFTYFYANEDVPDIRKILSFIGATEGWAQYASNLSTDYLDLSENEKRIIYINDLFSYILCSRVDVGVNYEGWDLEDTREYLSNYIDANTETVESLYYSATGDPGLYFPYTTGYIMMVDLRKTAEEELGDEFDACKYHEWLLNTGITSFEVYEEQLEIWLDAQ